MLLVLLLQRLLAGVEQHRNVFGICGGKVYADRLNLLFLFGLRHRLCAYRVLRPLSLINERNDLFIDYYFGRYQMNRSIDNISVYGQHVRKSLLLSRKLGLSGAIAITWRVSCRCRLRRKCLEKQFHWSFAFIYYTRCSLLVHRRVCCLHNASRVCVDVECAMCV